MAITRIVSGGVSNLQADIPELTQNTEFNYLCDTSIAPVVILLPNLSTFNGQVPTLNFIDSSGNASVNTITIQATNGDFFPDGTQSIVISVNGGSIGLRTTGQDWIIVLPMKFTAFSGSVTLKPADILALNTTEFKLAKGVAGKTIVPTFMVATLKFKNIAYVMGAGSIFNTFGGLNTTASIANTFVADTKSIQKNVTVSAIGAVDNTLLDLAAYAGQDWGLKASDPITTGDSDIQIDFAYSLIG